jgi:capsular exopolysaccharide synthesis family protein
MSRIYEALRRAESQLLESLRPGSDGKMKGSAADLAAGNDAPRDWISEGVPPRSPVAPSPGPSDLSALADVPCKRVEVPIESRLVFCTDPGGPAADRIRYLRMRLRQQAAAGSLRTLLITSPRPRDGKSTIALNLATALAEGGKNTVLLVEGDYYQSTISDTLGLDSPPGLAECVEDDLDPVRALCRIEPLGWYCMPNGKPNGNPAELLQSEALSGVMQKLRDLFDWIVVDSPPVLPISDTLSLSRHVDASLLVVRAGRTQSADVEEALALLGPRHVLGLVLNGSEDMTRRYGEYYGYYRPKGSGGRQ